MKPVLLSVNFLESQLSLYEIACSIGFHNHDLQLHCLVIYHLYFKGQVTSQ